MLPSSYEIGTTAQQEPKGNDTLRWWARTADQHYSKRPSVVIEVKEGRVEGVYSPDPELDIDILDLDTTDIEEEEDLMARHLELMEQCERGELHSLL